MKYVDFVNILDCRTHLRRKSKETVLHGDRERAICPYGGHPGPQWDSQPEEGEEKDLPYITGLESCLPFSPKSRSVLRCFHYSDETAGTRLAWHVGTQIHRMRQLCEASPEHVL